MVKQLDKYPEKERPHLGKIEPSMSVARHCRHRICRLATKTDHMDLHVVPGSHRQKQPAVLT